jgi:four helix bundle protein
LRGEQNIKSYRDLEIWKHSRLLVKNIYQLTAKFPSDERFGLMSQMRRAAVSIPSNIAEGHARPGRKDFAQFIAIAIGSSAELETQLILSHDLGYAPKLMVEPFMSEIDQLQKMMHKLHQSLVS